MELLKVHLHGDKTKIDVCTIKESDIAKHWKTDAKEEMEQAVQFFNLIGSILATRLPSNGNFQGMIDFIDAFRPDTTDHGIRRRLVSFK